MDQFPKQKEQKEIFITTLVFVLAVISFEIDNISILHSDCWDVISGITQVERWSDRAKF